MINNRKNKKGFTLVELLTVISIIGLLSSVVYSSLQSSKLKAKDAAVRAGVRELAKLMELEYSDTGSYAGLQSG
jgi:prepilin-type N-terminal cleavage/methylation domain-containing protein